MDPRSLRLADEGRVLPGEWHCFRRQLHRRLRHLNLAFSRPFSRLFSVYGGRWSIARGVEQAGVAVCARAGAPGQCQCVRCCFRLEGASFGIGIHQRSMHTALFRAHGWRCDSCRKRSTCPRSSGCCERRCPKAKWCRYDNLCASWWRHW